MNCKHDRNYRNCPECYLEQLERDDIEPDNTEKNAEPERRESESVAMIPGRHYEDE